MTADASLIRAERYQEIGSIIRRDTAQLIDRWARRAAEEQPTAPRVHHRVLLNHLPVFLATLGAHLAGPGDDGLPHCRQAYSHGVQRWETGWSLAEVIRDYRILQLVLLEHLDAALDRPLAVMEVQAVGLAIDEAIEASVQSYVAGRDEQLRQVQEGLKEADRRKNEFLAILAHEMRNPLAPLSSCLDLLRLAADSPETTRQVREMMERQVRQMTRLMEDLLDVSRIAQGKLVLVKGRLDLRSAVDQAVQMNAPLRRDRRHQLSLSVPEEPVWVEGDQARLAQVFVNLLNNSAKYTEPGGTLAAELEHDGDYVVVRFRDNGIGIEPAKLTQIWDLFSQLDLNPDRTEGGLGIGLTLVKRLVELHDGTISAASGGAGKGSEFVVRMPAAPPAPSTPATPSSERKTAAGRHVLIVEDNADGRESLALLLRLMGHRVDVAEDGLTGVAAAAALRPEVALIDIGLPGMDGFEAARQIRATLGDGLVLVALTGFGQPEDLRKGRDAGFNAHLVKPVDLEALRAILLGA